MKNILCAAAFLLSLLLLSPQRIESAVGQDISVSFRTQVAVLQEQIVLGDIADVHGGPGIWVEKISGIPIRKSPGPGEILFLSRDEVAQKIRNSGLASLMPGLRIPERIAVLREGRTVELEEIRELLEKKLADLHGQRTVKIKEVRVSEDLLVPSGLLSWEVQLPEQARRGGQMSATMLVLADGREIKKIRVHARVEIYAPVVVASLYLKRHQEITRNDVQVVPKDLSVLPPDVLLEASEIVGKRTTLSVNPQEVLRRGMVEVPPVVKKGDRILLIVENQQFKVTTLGEAQQEGRRGERIRVVNVNSKKEVVGKILDGHTVQVEY